MNPTVENKQSRVIAEMELDLEILHTQEAALAAAGEEETSAHHGDGAEGAER